MKLFNKIFICKDEVELESDYICYCNNAINKQLRNENKYLEERNYELYIQNDQLKQEIEELKKPRYIINFKTNEITKLTNDFISKDKIKEIIENHKKFLSNEFSKYSEDDIENRKAIQYASVRLSFLLADIYKLGE